MIQNLGLIWAVALFQSLFRCVFKVENQRRGRETEKRGEQ